MNDSVQQLQVKAPLHPTALVEQACAIPSRCACWTCCVIRALCLEVDTCFAGCVAYVLVRCMLAVQTPATRTQRNGAGQHSAERQIVLREDTAHVPIGEEEFVTLIVLSGNWHRLQQCIRHNTAPQPCCQLADAKTPHWCFSLVRHAPSHASFSNTINWRLYNPGHDFLNNMSAPRRRLLRRLKTLFCKSIL